MYPRHLLGLMAAAPLFAIGCSSGKIAEKNADITSAQASSAEPIVSKVEDSAADAYVVNENLKPVYFEISESKLSGTANETLKANAEWLKQNPPFLLEIAGASDMRGSAKRNQTLAERRAVRVRDAYALLGIPKERIAVLATTESPACKELTEECLQQGRRAETLVENKSLVSKP